MNKDFCYVQKDETKQTRKEIETIIREVQNEVRDDFTFQFHIKGSAKRNMITKDVKSNTGYDFDYDIEPHCDFSLYSPEKIKRILRLAFEKVGRDYGYTRCEDSTRALTLKQYAAGLIRGDSIFHSCDFAIIRNGREKQEYIHFDKHKNQYLWEKQPDDFEGIDDKIDYIKKKGCWNDVRNEYIMIKNSNQDNDKKSRSLFAEAVNNVYNQLKNR